MKDNKRVSEKMRDLWKLAVLIAVLASIIILTSCVEMCYDEYTYHFEDGTTETVIVEYECNN